MPSLTAQGRVTGGLAMPVMHYVLLTTILMDKVSCGQLTLQGIYLEYQTKTSCLTLQTRFGLPQSAETNGLPMSSSMGVSLALAWVGVGACIVDLLRILTIAISASLKRVMQMAASLISRY